MGSEGIRCEECGERHEDWEKTGETEFERGMHAGVRERLECERCGFEIGQVKR